MTIIDRRYGVAEGLAVKAPCRLATTGNITLAGLQTIDGLVAAANDRVLVWNQTDATRNGIYLASSGNWVRELDFDGSLDVVCGTRVYVTSGTVYGRHDFVVTTADPITPGTSTIALSPAPLSTAGLFFQRSEAGAVLVPLDTVLKDLPITPRMFGVAYTGADEQVALQNALNAALASGSYLVQSAPGKTICVANPPSIPDGVTLDLNGGKLKKIGAVNSSLIHLGNNSTFRNFVADSDSLATTNTTIHVTGKSGFVIENGTIQNSTLHGLYCQDCTGYTVRRVKWVNGAYELGAFISYHLAADAADIVVEDCNFDLTNLAQMAIFFVPQTPHTVSRLRLQNNNGREALGDISGNEHSLICLLGYGSGEIFFDCVVSGNRSKDLNFPFSLTNMKNSSVVNNVGVGGTLGYCYELAANVNCTYTGNVGQGEFISGCPFIFNTSVGCVGAGNIAINDSTDPAAITVQALGGSKNVWSGGVIRSKGGTGLSITGDDYVVDGVFLDGMGTAVNAINLNTGSRRHIKGILTTGFTGTPVVNINATDTVDTGTGGSREVVANFIKNANTTLANVTGLSADLAKGRTYSFEAMLLTASNVAGGVKAAIAGTATASAIRHEATIFEGAAVVLQTRGTALATAFGITAVVAATIRISGSIKVNAAGTLTVQFAQNASNGADSIVLDGSWFKVWEE